MKMLRMLVENGRKSTRRLGRKSWYTVRRNPMPHGRRWLPCYGDLRTVIMHDVGTYGEGRQGEAFRRGWFPFTMVIVGIWLGVRKWVGIGMGSRKCLESWVGLREGRRGRGLGMVMCIIALYFVKLLTMSRKLDHGDQWGVEEFLGVDGGCGIGVKFVGVVGRGWGGRWFEFVLLRDAFISDLFGLSEPQGAKESWVFAVLGYAHALRYGLINYSFGIPHV
ncbi:hypothetical protein Tco_0318851 [Tanacetum coccineum]